MIKETLLKIASNKAVRTLLVAAAGAAIGYGASKIQSYLSKKNGQDETSPDTEKLSKENSKLKDSMKESKPEKEASEKVERSDEKKAAEKSEEAKPNKAKSKK